MRFKRVFLLVSLICLTGLSFAKVNINTATIEEMSMLHGIGAHKAAAIVEYRENNGKFSSVEELVKVKGIGKKTVKRLKDQLTVRAKAEKSDAKDRVKSDKKATTVDQEKGKKEDEKPVTKQRYSSKKGKKKE